ncbi:uncharacterized protein LOC112056377 [Bicyclus anynana]|uniref:Uncharacterized protein LOC112056377 n=1 Tax=Bicyclus anynana TaxID=110368 RepID=A0ABM3LV30_BICAN|nr:uncharacterized protein LOC112056377 [Bicyclus anynana]
MASITFILEIMFSITLILALTLPKAEASKPSNLLSLLTNTIHHHKQPIILILEKDAVINEDRARLDNVLSLESSAEDGNRLIHQLLGHDQPKMKAVQYKKSTRKPYQLSDKNRYRVQRDKEDRSLQNEDKTLRSPIVKKLLRISNSLRCEAKDECKDKCANKFSGTYKIKCNIQCTYKYSCEDKVEDRDSCDGSDECGSESEVQMSTKGEHMVTDKPGCKRC